MYGSIRISTCDQLSAGMAVITLNVVGDAATTVIVSYKENELDKDVYNS